ncbi:prepilin-type N-terminal cleavage/methylation domain-containing protein [Desulfonatronum thioautotrophicum]|uniref:prepilin-type N-terminal cleavage/methylation domain-containing protein n=1 Tax=Desulfonatronum thioautotrophicum TaxID=617001 RepID=UPI0005EB5F73|nr:prepilin-type N-terminal cleavage/methylation domain-containing protein [Desulfonatronum thioautotrophicum]
MRSDGFSLLELLVVVLIMGAAMGVLFGYNYTQRETVRLRSSVGEVGQFLRMAQGLAILEGQDNGVVFLAERHVLRETLRGRELTLPEVVRLVGNGGGTEGEESRLVLFFADGSAMGEDLLFTAAEREIRLRIDPILGEAKVVDD